MDKHPFEWKIRQIMGGWEVIDYNGSKHTFTNETAARQFIDRDKKMLASHSKQVFEELSGEEGIFEPPVDEESEVKEHGEEVGFTYNRADRRRVERLAGRRPSSRRGRKPRGVR